MADAEFAITKKDWDKIQGYATIAYDKHKCEIGGMMVMVMDDAGDYLMQDPVILKQEISGAECDLDDDALAEYYGKALHKYGPGTRFVWWHSHHTMAAFWSGTDMKTIEGTPTADFSVSLVINLKGEYKLRVQYFHPINIGEDIELNILNAPGKYTKDMEKEVKALCEVPTVSVIKYGGYTYNNRGQGTLFNHRQIAPQANVMDLEKILELTENTLNKCITGEWDYAMWRTQVRAINDSIKDTGYKIREFKKKKLHDMIYTATAIDFLTFKDVSVETAEDMPPADDRALAMYSSFDERWSI